LALFVSTLIIVHYSRRGPRITFNYILSAASVLLFFFLVMTPLRKGVSPARYVEDMSTDEVLNISSRSMMTRMAYVSDGVPENIGLKYGQTYVLWLVSPIPRSVWPEKPIISTGSILGPLLFRPNADRADIGNIGGVPPKFLAELYWNFGPLGIPLGMFVLGGMLRVMYNSVRPHLGSNLFIVSSYAAIIFPLSKLPTVSPFMVGAIKALVPLAFISFITRKTKG